MASSNSLKLLKFGPHLREIRIHLCQKSDASKGVREFLNTNYVSIKKNNPQFPILVRECSGIYPKIFARYGAGKEASVLLTNFSSQEVGKTLEDMSQPPK
ncbi:ndufa2, NADH:ubiquinone oxidoreductase 10.5kD subunit [Chamberlinius hualienensis]